MAWTSTSLPLHLLGLAALLAAGCIGELDRASSVHDLRVLAIRADPPEVYLARDPAVFDFTALVADVCGGRLCDRALNFRASTCPEPVDLRCEGAPDEVLIGEGVFQGETLDFSFDVDLAGEAFLEKALSADPYKGFGGLPVAFSLKIWADGEEEVVHAIKRVVLHLPGLSLEDEPANGLPAVPALLWAGAPVEASRPLALSGGEVELDIVAPEAIEKERYRVPTFTGGARDLIESWRYDWFTSKGRFSPETTGGKALLSSGDDPTPSTLRFEEEDAAGDLAIWVVVHDGRGGVSWTRQQAHWDGVR